MSVTEQLKLIQKNFFQLKTSDNRYTHLQLLLDVLIRVHDAILPIDAMVILHPFCSEKLYNDNDNIAIKLLSEVLIDMYDDIYYSRYSDDDKSKSLHSTLNIVISTLDLTLNNEVTFYQ